MPIKSRIRTVPHWPKKGIMFRDITTLLKDPVGLKICIEDFVKRYKDQEIDVIVGIDGETITSPEQASDFFQKLAEGGEVTIKLKRRRRTRQIKLNIE